jgi:uncharacterized protein (TIGR02145 family)
MVVSPIQIQHGKISFTFSERLPVAISVHDIGGRLVYSSRKTYEKGTHTIAALLQSNAIYIYNVNFGNISYSFKSSPLGTFSVERGAKVSGMFTSAKLAKTVKPISDVISVVKEGQLNYRRVVKAADTSGIVINMIPNAGDVVDVDGNAYQSVRIGNQVWTVENLRVTKYNDGTAIPLVEDDTIWDNPKTPGYCFYNNSKEKKYQKKWGALYNWYAVNTGKLAPGGWHVPTDTEWTTLENYLSTNGYNWDGTTTGHKFAKSMAAKTDWECVSWYLPGSGLLSLGNGSGMSVLPAGARLHSGDFVYQVNSGIFWGATEYDPDTNAYCYQLECGYEDIYSYYAPKISGCSVRLVRD